MTLKAFEAAQKTIDWAWECLNLGNNAFIDFVESDESFVFVIENNAETHQEVRKFRQLKPLPNSVEGMLRTAVLDFKHSYDMSLFAAAQALGSVRFDRSYPWADSPAGLEKILAKRQLKQETRLPQVLIDEIRRQQPYATGASFTGGNDVIREVAKMANGKHTIGINTSAAISKAQPAIMFMQAPLHGSVRSGFTWDPIKKEIIVSIMTGEGGIVSHSQPSAEIDIFFEFTGIIGKIPAQAVVAHFGQGAQLVLEGFRRAYSAAAV